MMTRGIPTSFRPQTRAAFGTPHIGTREGPPGLTMTSSRPRGYGLDKRFNRLFFYKYVKIIARTPKFTYY